jgi:hypothetical protein
VELRWTKRDKLMRPRHTQIYEKVVSCMFVAFNCDLALITNALCNNVQKLGNQLTVNRTVCVFLNET